MPAEKEPNAVVVIRSNTVRVRGRSPIDDSRFDQRQDGWMRTTRDACRRAPVNDAKPGNAKTSSTRLPTAVGRGKAQQPLRVGDRVGRLSPPLGAPQLCRQ
jgi:hypothetical protein